MTSIWGGVVYIRKEMGLTSFPVEGPRKPTNENKSKNPSLPAKVRGWVLTPDLVFVENFLGFLLQDSASIAKKHRDNQHLSGYHGVKINTISIFTNFSGNCFLVRTNRTP